MTWVEVVGRKAIAANPAVYVDQLTADVAALEADFAEAKAALEALKQKIQDALGSAAPSSTASSTATPSST